MSELNDRIDKVREKLIEDSRTPVGMGNARQKLRAAQELVLEIINVLDRVIEQIDRIEAEVAKGET